MATTSITISITYTWWLKVYLGTLATLCCLMDCEPNTDRVGYWIGKGIRLKVV